MKILLISSLIILMSCGHSRTIHFYSLNKSQCVTVLDKGDHRYIINGEHKSIPFTNFVKLDMSIVDPLISSFHICWENEQYEWEVIVDKAIIVDSQLDASKFKFSNEIPTDERGIPSEIKFRQNGCAVYSFYLMKLSPDKGAIVEID